MLSPEEKGRTIAIEYLPDAPSYVRPTGYGWMAWITGFILVFIGVYTLPKP
jgi:hypothetical protein